MVPWDRRTVADGSNTVCCVIQAVAIYEETAVLLGGGRVELRAADSANNPYPGGVMVLAAGLEGINEKIDPGSPHTENMYLKTDQELTDMGVSYLPRTLAEAVDHFEADPLGRQVMGDLMFKTFVDFKRDEWDSYHSHVSDWEVDRYLKLW